MFQELKDNYKQDKWVNQITETVRETNLKSVDMKNISKDKIKKILQESDTQEWKTELNEKSSVVLYRNNKTEICEEKSYDNHPSSITFLRCRSNTVALNDRNRFNNGDVKCSECSAELENLEHFILYCPAYTRVRQESNIFIQPYEENFLGDLLFGKIEKREEIKRILHKFWTTRRKLQERRINQ